MYSLKDFVQAFPIVVSLKKTVFDWILRISPRPSQNKKNSYFFT